MRFPAIRRGSLAGRHELGSTGQGSRMSGDIPRVPPPELGMKGLYVGKGTLPMEVIPGYPRGPGAT